MRHIYSLFVMLAAALTGAVLLESHRAQGTTFAETSAAAIVPALAPLADTAEAHVPVPDPLPAGSTASSGTSDKRAPRSRRAPQPGRPVHLAIPQARVNARVIDVGVTPAGNLDVPPNYVEVGWYMYGTKPGEVGSAVLDGHVDNGASIDGVFKHLRDLSPGDEIKVTTEAGETLVFRVRELDIYPTKAFPSEQIFHERGGRLLKIITCHGNFIPSEDTYDQRLVVTAELVD